MSEGEKRLAESVSALVDGETDELELQRLLKHIGAEQQDQLHSIDSKSIRGKWSRYHLMSQVMADSSLNCRDISSAVSDAISKEKSYSSIRLGKVFDPVFRLAVAASVAMVAIFGVQQLSYMDLQQITDFKLAEMDADPIKVDEANTGPALQYPADFQPYVPARTVSAGGNTTPKQQPMTLLKVNTQRDIARDQQVRSLLSEILEIHAINESNNGIQGMLPYARHIDAGEDATPE